MSDHDVVQKHKKGGKKGESLPANLQPCEPLCRATKIRAVDLTFSYHMYLQLILGGVGLIAKMALGPL